MRYVISFGGIIIAALVPGFGSSLLLGFPVMWLWNWLVPALFQGPNVTFWQAFGMLLLCSLLFKGTHSSASS